MKLSRNEQDYLKSICMLFKKNEFISVKSIADYLKISVPSVNEMIKRLEKKDLVKYYAYKGIKLTKAGELEALFIIKSHRLWEYFLVNKLGYQIDEVHDAAEILEHNASKKLVEKLYKYLEEPKICPHGRKIPDKIFWEEESKIYEFSEIIPGMIGELILSDEIAKKYIKEFELENIKWVEILKRIEIDSTIIIRAENNKNNLVLPKEIQKHFKLKIVN